MKKKVVVFLFSLFVFIISGCNIVVNSNEQEQNSNSATATKAKIEAIAFYQLTGTLLNKFEEGKIEEVKSAILKLDTIIPKYKDDWNYGNAVHKMNIAAGRIALKENRIEDAKKFLFASVNTKGSPQMNSFGPNMTLAKELLEKGERKAVIQYFNLCSKFWESGESRLNKWEGIVKQGYIPDFGANLKY